jgi:glycerate kinase
VRQGATRVIVGVGGSATCDGGLGMAQACGAVIRLRSGKTYAASDRKITGSDAAKVVSVGRRGEDTSANTNGLLRFAGVEIVVAADVGNPLYGPDGAAHIFGPQKGATPAQVRHLDDGLRKLSERLGLTDFARLPASGAGGGTGFGLMALFGAQAVSGAQLIFDYLNLTARLKGVDLCLTGEGRFDMQSLGGKAPMAVARACQEANVPCVVLAGSLGDGWHAAHHEGVTAALSILNRPMALVEAQDHAADLVMMAAEQVMRLAVATVVPG